MKTRIATLEKELSGKSSARVPNPVINILENGIQNLKHINFKTFKDYNASCVWSASEVSTVKLISFYSNMAADKNYTPELKLKLVYNSLKCYLLDDDKLQESFASQSYQVDSSNAEKIISSLFKRLEFISDDISRKSLCLAKFLLKSSDNRQTLQSSKAVAKSRAFLDIKDVYLDSYYFDEENREYLKNCIIEYTKIKLAARRITRNVSRMYRQWKLRQANGKKPMDYCVFKAATGKMVLKELLDKVTSTLRDVRTQIE